MARRRRVLVGREKDGKDVWIDFAENRARSTVELSKISLPHWTHADIYLVPFHTGHRVHESDNRPYNDGFPLRYYIPKAANERNPNAQRKLFVFLNGFGEGSTRIWDLMADRLAELGVASVLLPMPEHFCRNAFYNINAFNEEDPYRLEEAANFDGRVTRSISKRSLR